MLMYSFSETLRFRYAGDVLVLCLENQHFDNFLSNINFLAPSKQFKNKKNDRALLFLDTMLKETDTSMISQPIESQVA